MPTPFRVIDTGVREGRSQIAFDAALIELHKEGRSPDTVRFLRFPPTALIGRHQALRHEVRLDYCLAHGIGLVRRITGGGAIYLDENQLGWELVLSRERLPMASLGAYAQAICEAVAGGLSKAFGIEARFRPRNDIEVGGRKLCGTGGFFDGGTLIYQGTVLVDLDPGRMTASLNVPGAKLAKRALDDPGRRVVTLKELLGGEAPEIFSVQQAVLLGLANGLGLTLRHGTTSAEEEELAKRHHEEEIGTDPFVFEVDEPRGPEVGEGAVTGPGGTVAAFVRMSGEGQGRRVGQALITGDFFITPPRLVYDLEASLKDLPAAEAGAAVDRFFAEHAPDMLSAAPADFRLAVERALASAGPPS